MNQPCLIELLGGLQVRQGDRTITRFRTQKTAALLGYLACFLKRSHPREELVELLWPDTDLEDGRASLRVSLSSLRQQLEPPDTPYNSVLIADRSSARLNAAVVSTDAGRFESLVRSAAGMENQSERIETLKKVVETYRGPLLPGFYDDWAVQERERLEQVYAGVLGELPLLLRERGDIAQAIDYAHRRVQIEPLLEEAHEDLIQLYLSAGRVEEARKQYEDLERILREELGASPSEDVSALIADLPVARQGRKLSGQTRVRTVAKFETESKTAWPASLPQPDGSPHRPLPLHLAPFFGREEELARLRELLEGHSIQSAGDCQWTQAGPESTKARLITLTGPGGTGKTRLAVEAGRRISDRFGGRVAFVPLAEATESSQFLDAVLNALALTRMKGVETLDQIVQALGREPFVLILDNFEQLVEPSASTVWDMLERGEALVCLVTSRQRLGLEGEREVPIQPLAVPSAPGTPERLIEFPSVRLFVDRAQAARPDFQITRENAASIAVLCEKLEGLPLAVELAAAWASVMTPSQMLARLEEPLTFLSSRRKGGPVRHRSLYDTIEWSYQLLSPELQRLFARLSVFRGGWTLESAEAVCSAESDRERGLPHGKPARPSRQPAMLESLEELQARSLIVSMEVGGEMRFRMLETLREFGRDRLGESGDEDSIRRRHLEHFLAIGEESHPRMRGQHQSAAFDELSREVDNLRAALDFAIEGSAQEHEYTVARAGSADLGLRLAITLHRFWEVRGYWSEGQNRLAQLLARTTYAPNDVRARAFEAAGTLAWQQAQFAEACAHLEESLSLFRACGDKQGIADALHGLGVIREERGDYEAACSLLEESLAIKRELGDKWGLSASLNTLANAVTGTGDYETARSLYRESLQLKRELEDHRGISILLNNLGIVAYDHGEYAEARSLLEEALSIRRKIGDLRGIGTCLNNLAELAWRQGELVRARSLLEESLEIRRQLGDRFGVASSLLILGHVAVGQKEYSRAQKHYAESLSIWQDLGFRVGVAEALEHTAHLALLQEDLEKSAQLFGAAEALRQCNRAAFAPIELAVHEERIGLLRSKMPEAEFQSAWQEGLDLPLSDSAGLALGGRISGSD